MIVRALVLAVVLLAPGCDPIELPGPDPLPTPVPTLAPMPTPYDPWVDCHVEVEPVTVRPGATVQLIARMVCPEVAPTP